MPSLGWYQHKSTDSRAAIRRSFFVTLFSWKVLGLNLRRAGELVYVDDVVGIIFK